MKATPLAIPEVVILEPQVFGDDRGFFYESYNRQKFRDATGVDPDFVQDNHSRSQRNVLRGLHYQLPPKAQGKLVRAIVGEVFDVAVDIRKSSPTFGKWVGALLSAQNKKQLWIPPGFAHGFVTLSDAAEFMYKTTEFHSPPQDRCIRWDDPAIGITWPLDVAPLLSSKDQRGVDFPLAEVFP